MTTTNQCITLAGHFDGHGNAPVRYWAHWPMHCAQCFNWSHWTPQSVKYSLRIAPATARSPFKQAKNTNTTNASHSLAISMAKAMRRYSTECIDQWVVPRASIEATGHQNWLNIRSISPRWPPGSHTSSQRKTIKWQNKHRELPYNSTSQKRQMNCLLYFPRPNFVPKIGGHASSAQEAKTVASSRRKLFTIFWFSC